MKEGAAATGDGWLRLRNAEGWGYFEMDASHSPFITAPEALATIFDTIARAT